MMTSFQTRKKTNKKSN